MRPNRYVTALFCIFLGLCASSAKAAMVFCNRTQNALEAAFGYRDGTDWISEGWWQIEPGQCARVYAKPLNQRFYFYYAKALVAPVNGVPLLNWSGKYELCIDTKAFRIEGDSGCEARNYHTQGFQEVDIGSSTRDYTLDFKDKQ